MLSISSLLAPIPLVYKKNYDVITTNNDDVSLILDSKIANLRLHYDYIFNVYILIPLTYMVLQTMIIILH